MSEKKNNNSDGTAKRSKGRPKGSKNKRKGVDELPAEFARKQLSEGMFEGDMSADIPNPDNPTDALEMGEVVEPEQAIVEKPQKVKKELPTLDFPANVLIIGKRFSGKTTLLLNIIDPAEFDNVFIVTVSDQTGNLNSLCRSDLCILNSISDEFIDKLIEIHKEDRLTRTLILFDDFLGSDFEPKKSQKMRLLASSGRNFNISVVFSSQDITGVPTMFRRNVEYLFLGAMNANSIKKVAEEYSTADMNKKQLEFNLKELAKAKDNSWLFYDDRKGEWSKIEGASLDPNVLP